MIIPMWVDENKDKKLIEWLNDFTNRSAAMRMYLYNCMNGIVSDKKENSELNDDFMDSLNTFEVEE